MAPSLKLIHRTANRWRYRLNDVLEINWERLRLDLSEKFPEGPWTVRLNPVASTLIIIQNERRLGQCSDPTYIVRASLSQQLAKQGIVVSEIPLSKTVVVQSYGLKTVVPPQESAPLLTNLLLYSRPKTGRGQRAKKIPKHHASLRRQLV